MPSSSAGKIAKSFLPTPVYSRLCKAYDRTRSTLFMLSSLGGNKQCPICEKRWKRFVPDEGEPSPLFQAEHIIGGGPSIDAVCPWCGSFERERLVYLYLKDHTRILDPGMSVMHMAPERRIQKWLANNMKGRYVSVDLQSPLAEVHADICDLPFEDNSFDFVICNHVLEHIPDDRQAIREIGRVLKVGGTALLQVPIAAMRKSTEEDPSLDEAQRLQRFGQHDHLRLYGLDYPDRLRELGLEVDCVPALECIGEEAVRRFGLLADEVLYIASKGTSP